MLGVGRVEVAAGAGEGGTLAPADCVDVDAVLARRQIPYLQGDADAGRGLGQSGGADLLAAGVADEGVCRPRGGLGGDDAGGGRGDGSGERRAEGGLPEALRIQRKCPFNGGRMGPVW